MNRPRVPAGWRRAAAERARGLCEYCRCQLRFSADPFEVEHIIPRSQRGRTTLNNLALACRGCNLYKSDKTTAIDPISNRTVPLFHPRRQQWNDHFSWNQDGTQIIGLTPIGRATVAALNLNREGLVNLRRTLHQCGEHPPD